MRKDLLAKAASGQPLSREEAREAGEDLASGTAEPLAVAAFLGALAARGETAEEVVGFAQAFREAAEPFPEFSGAVDTCGTGGDHRSTFNVSTAAAMVVASLGVPVAKHGNRSVSSSCGSADLLEAAGYPISEAPAEAQSRMERRGFVFLFAPRYHPAMAHVATVRKALGVRTLFNLLGPLLNPARVCRQVVGIYAEDRLDLMAGALAKLGAEHVLVVHGEGGYDEAVLSGRTQVVEVRGALAERYDLSASEFGLPEGSETDLTGGGAVRNREIFAELLNGGGRAGLRDAVAANAALALRAAGVSEDLREGAGRALESLKSGAAGRYFREVLGQDDEEIHAQVS